MKSCINQGGNRFKDIILFIISNSGNLIPHISLLRPRLPDMVQKCFCTPDRPMDPTFQTKYTQQICVQFDGDTDHKTNPTFLRHPVAV